MLFFCKLKLSKKLKIRNAMIGFCPLASGSKGNAIYFGTNKTKILIDAGLSAKELTKRLAEIDISLSDIDAILVSHEHTDHIRGLLTATQGKIPIVTNYETARSICEALQTTALNFKLFTTGERFSFQDLEISPFSIQHDAIDPVGFRIASDIVNIGICTDLGIATTLVERSLQNCDILYLEANHEPDFVMACSRPQIYKQRVLGKQGHLSNESCGKLLARLCHSNLKAVFLAHLSSECNRPDKALEVVSSFIEDKDQTFDLWIANQEEISQKISLEENYLLTVDF